MQVLPPADLAGITFQAATPTDLPRIAAFLSRAHPDSPVGTADLERADSFRLPGEVFRRTLALRGSELVGMAEVSVPRSENYPGWLVLEVAALPHEAAGDLPGVLLRLAEEYAVSQGGTTLLARVKEHWPERALYERAGYSEHDRLWPSTLDLRTLDFEAFAAEVAQAAATGVRLVPLSDFGPLDEPLQRRLYALIAALLRDVPSATPIKVWPFELWQQRYVPTLKHPEGLFLAVAPDGQWVGISELHMPIPQRPGTLHNGLTGVLPDWRGQRLALALKLAAARAALSRGFTQSRTSNHSINRPMLAINERLGFVREAAMVTVKKDV
ncbi:GNAT family N-acetyltransferase [Deinococcus deserti]|uniref:Putative N-acetyltransferase n=1 Tax=Deinococcus deserti (strain DSM 17065 / CIP 109153 / LMG 22923 / VCD115) TaxID=546414 RepID=C1CW82_DEIDV|nr:GNAT family N-acetyltransferase [Deinococcus deserti]ACO46449.2 putative N-acetyltransferase [Deinococcus deserti VCD115]